MRALPLVLAALCTAASTGCGLPFVCARITTTHERSEPVAVGEVFVSITGASPDLAGLQPWRTREPDDPEFSVAEERLELEFEGPVLLHAGRRVHWHFDAAPATDTDHRLAVRVARWSDPDSSITTEYASHWVCRSTSVIAIDAPAGSIRYRVVAGPDGQACLEVKLPIPPSNP